MSYAECALADTSVPTRYRDARGHVPLDGPDGLEPPWRDHRTSTDGDRGYVGAAMAETGATLDERGLMPLAEARAILAACQRLARGDGGWVKTAAAATEDLWVWDLDLTWAALLSLEHAGEAVRAFAAVRIVDPPRSAAHNRALVERYGDGAADIVLSCARSGHLAVTGSPFLRATVMALGTPAGFRLVAFELPEDPEVTSLLVEWIAAHPAVGYVELARLVEGNNPDAAALLERLASPQPREAFAWIAEGLGDEAARRVFDRAAIPVELEP
jgi:hypothetical protein